MTLPAAGETPWSVLEWAATGVSTALVGALAFVWRLLARLARLETQTAQQRLDFEAGARLAAAQTAQLGQRLDQILADQHRLRAAIAGLPNRYDLRDVEDHINERVDSVVARLDRALEARGG